MSRSTAHSAGNRDNLGGAQQPQGTSDDAEAGAVDLFGKGLPEAASVDRLYEFWPPARPNATIVVTIGLTREQLGAGCTSFQEVARVDSPAGKANNENGEPIGICRTTGTLASLWSALTH